ncbi:insulinase family protein [Mycoplasmatota bacterium]|nr:insulinase family protein [Mycoplasmatota bacterium]
MQRINYKINGLNVIFIKTDKFKTTDFILNFRNYLNGDTVTKRALIPYVLKAGTQNYSTKKEINEKLETLYGASLGISINKQGLMQILSMRMSIINDTYLMTNSTLLEDAFQFFHEVIFNPKCENNVFSEKIVSEEKRLLKAQFNALYDDKIRYAYDKLIEEMCKDENYRIKALGRIEDIDSIDPSNLYSVYQDILKNDTVDLLVIGDIDKERLKGLIEKHLSFNDRQEIKEVVDTQTKEIDKVNKIVESQELNQAKLNIGFRTNVNGKDNDYYHLLLMNAMLGVYPHSLLFRNVREKASLCYYISSNIDKAKGIMIIYAGINKKDFDQAYKLVLDQINKLITGDFDEALMNNSSKALVNDLLQMSDNPIAVLASEYSHLLYDEIFDINSIIEKIKAVTKEDIQKVAQKLKEDTIFFLTKEEVNE